MSGRGSGLRLSLKPFAVLVAAVLAVAGSTLSGFAVELARLSDDPYTNPDSQHRTEVEPDTHAFGSTVVSAFQVGRYYNGGASNIGWATSKDSGLTWTSGFLPGITVHEGGGYARASDPSVAYDAAHDVWMISSLGIVEPVRAPDLLISRSLDGGLTWSSPVTAHSSIFVDKNWSVCDDWPASPFYGNCYNQWDDVSEGNLIKMNVSSDGGLTWGPGLPTADLARGLGGQPVVQPDGTVVVPFSTNFGPIRAFQSSDGGVTWEASVLVSSVFHHSTVGLRSPPLPSAKVDSGGNVIVAWSDCRYREGCSGNDIVISTSGDGLAWSSPARVPIDGVTSGADYTIPGLAVDLNTPAGAASLGIAFYYYPVSACSVSTCQLLSGYISSPDGGLTWTDPVALSETPMLLSWLADTNQGRMVGDYIGTAYTPDGTAHPVIAVALQPNAEFDEAMYTPVVGLVRAGALAHRSSKSDRVLLPAGVEPAAGTPGVTLN